MMIKMAQQRIMSQDFNNGTALVTMGKTDEGEWLDLGKYVVRFDYEATNSLQACQFSRNAVVGYRTDMIPSIGRVAFPRQGITDPISDETKLGTTVTVTVKVLNRTTGQPVANLPLYYGFGKNDTRNYFDDDSTEEEIISRYDNSQKVAEPVTTNAQGVATISFTLDKFFTASNISNSGYRHTLYVRLKGTSDRASNDNYVRNIACCPLVIGSVPTYAPVVQSEPPQVAGTLNANAKTCGGGTIKVSIDMKQSFAYQDGGVVRTGFEAFTDSITEGYFEVYEVNGSTETKVDINNLSLDNGTNEIQSGGKITLESSGSPTTFIIKNNKQINATGTMQYIVRYSGVAGYINPRDFTFNVALNPSYDSYTKLDVDIELVDDEEPIIVVFNAAKNIQLKVFREDDTNKNALSSGQIEYTVE